MELKRIIPESKVTGESLQPMTPEKTKTEKEIKQSIKDRVDLSKKDEAPPTAPPEGKKKWTVLAYLDGNTFEAGRMAPAKLRQLEIAGSNENLNIVAQLSRSPSIIDKYSKDWSGTKRYLVEKNPDPPMLQDEMVNWFIPPYTQNIVSKPVQDLGQTDAGDPKTLTDFLKWGIKNYPAEHYAVVMYGPGGGFAGSMADSKTGNVIDSKELASSLTEASESAGKKIDLVAFDSNFMAQGEVGNEIKDSADILVAPQSTVALGSLPLDMVMKDLRFGLDEKDITGKDLADFFIFEAKYQPRPVAEMMAPTLSAVDLAKLEDVKTAAGEFSKSLVAAVKGKPKRLDALREDIKLTQNFVAAKGSKSEAEPYSDYRDLQNFVENVLADKRISDPAVKEKGQKVIDAVKNAVIGEVHTGKAVKDAHGISAYIPDDYGFDLPPTFFTPKNWDPKHGYENMDFGKSGWDEFLSVVAKDTKFHTFLRNQGAPDHVINKIDKIGGAAKKTALFALAVAGNAGSYESYQAFRKKPPKDFFFIPAKIASEIGIAGGGYRAFKGAQKILEALGNEDLKNKSAAVIDGAADTTEGIAIAAANIGMNVAKASGITTPAAIVAFAIPIAKMVYTMYTTFKQQQKGRQASSEIDPLDKLARIQIEKMTKTQEKQDDYYVSPLAKDIAQKASPGTVNPKDLLQK